MNPEASRQNHDQIHSNSDHPATHMGAVYAGVYLSAQAGASYYVGMLEAWRDDGGPDEGRLLVRGVLRAARRTMVELRQVGEHLTESDAALMRQAIDALIVKRGGKPVDLAVLDE